MSAKWKWIGEKVGVPLGIWVFTTLLTHALKTYGGICMIKSLFQTFVIELWPMWIGFAAVVFYWFIKFLVGIYKACAAYEKFQKGVLVINSAEYGIAGQTNDVTDILRSKVVWGRIENFSVTNDTLGPDPAKHKSKEVTVRYRYCCGDVRTKVVPEGGVLSLPE